MRICQFDVILCIVTLSSHRWYTTRANKYGGGTFSWSSMSPMFGISATVLLFAKYSKSCKRWIWVLKGSDLMWATINFGL